MALAHAAPGEKVRIEPLGPAIAEAVSTALVKTDRFEALRLVMKAGSTLPPHAVEGFITLHCLEGSVLLEADREIEMRAGDWIYLDRDERHGLRAHDDSSLLLTIFFDRTAAG